MNKPYNQFELPGFINISILVIWMCSLIIIVYFSLQPSMAITAQSRYLDKIFHLLSYLWLAMLLMFYLRTNRSFLLVPVLLILLGIALEILQSYIPGRFYSVPDMISNSLGVVAGALLGKKIKSLLAKAIS